MGIGTLNKNKSPNNNAVAKIDISDALILSKNRILNSNAIKGNEIKVIKTKVANSEREKNLYNIINDII
ncbi:hypothetical protein [Lactobacillus helveticus]|uniref:hypothetical protein n=1 Tax=Lactobacillus helveticus TaxID=1587 RepID=UPI001C64AA2F|nr:hypothetical protein [Lactobacillus helveticus]